MADEQVASSRIFTVANAVSVVRLMAIPVFLWLVIEDRLLIAFVLLVVAVLSDFVDGMIARRMNEITKLGQFLDPFADRLFIAATVIALAIQDVVPWWFVIAVMLRDALLGIGGVVMARYGAATLPVKWWGKVATFAMLVVLPLFLLGAVVRRSVRSPIRLRGCSPWPPWRSIGWSDFRTFLTPFRLHKRRLARVPILEIG